MKLFVRVLAGLCLLLAASCARVDLAVRYADTYIMWEADHFFDLTSAQEKEAKPEVEAALKDVREHDFPEMAKFLETIRADLKKDGATMKHADEWFARSRELFYSSLRKFETPVQNFSKTATPEQEKRFISEFNDNLDSLRTKAKTPDKILDADLTRIGKWEDFLTLKPTRDQARVVENTLRDHPTPFALQIKERERFLKDMMATKGEARKARLHKFFTDPESFRSAEAVKTYKERDQALKEMIVKVWGMLSDEQKKDLDRHLKEKADDFRGLAKVE